MVNIMNPYRECVNKAYELMFSVPAPSKSRTWTKEGVHSLKRPLVNSLAIVTKGVSAIV